MSALERYLRELHLLHGSGAAVNETSYYPALATLLNAVGRELKPRVHCIVNPKNRGAGIPDGGLFTPDQLGSGSEGTPLLGLLPARGAIEAKGAGEDAWAIAASAQVAKYWGMYRQVLVTNLRDFVLVGQNAEGRKAIYRLAEDEDAFWTSAALAIWSRRFQVGSWNCYRAQVLRCCRLRLIQGRFPLHFVLMTHNQKYSRWKAHRTLVLDP